MFRGLLDGNIFIMINFHFTDLVVAFVPLAGR